MIKLIKSNKSIIKNDEEMLLGDVKGADADNDRDEGGLGEKPYPLWALRTNCKPWCSAHSCHWVCVAPNDGQMQKRHIWMCRYCSGSDRKWAGGRDPRKSRYSHRLTARAHSSSHYVQAYEADSLTIPVHHRGDTA